MAQSVTISVASTGRKITVPTGLFINNEFVPSVDSKETIEYVRMHRKHPASRGICGLVVLEC